MSEKTAEELAAEAGSGQAGNATGEVEQGEQVTEPARFVVLAGFQHGVIDEQTGDGLAQHFRGDVITLNERDATVELQRNRIVAYDADVAAAVLASVTQEPAS